MKRRLNRLDIFIVVMLVIVIGIFAYKKTTTAYDAFKGDAEIPQMEEMSLTYYVENVRDYTYNAVVVGDAFYDDDSGAYIGEAKKVWKEPFRNEIQKNDGTVVYEEVPGRFVVYVTIVGPVVETEDKVLAGGSFELKMNSKIMLASNRVLFEGKLAYFGE